LIRALELVKDGLLTASEAEQKTGALPPLPDNILSRATTNPKVQTPTDADLYDLAAEYSGDPVPAMRSALALWGSPAVAPVAVSERPWELDGWCDAEGRCWVGEPERDYPLGETGDFDIWLAEWKLTDPRSFVGAARPVVFLLHWAMPLPNHIANRGDTDV